MCALRCLRVAPPMGAWRGYMVALAVIHSVHLCVGQQPTCSPTPGLGFRETCGDGRLSQTACSALGCCFNIRLSLPCYRRRAVPVAVPGAPGGGEGLCASVALPHREDCGHGGISRTACLRRSCCFDNTKNNVPYCYFNTFIQIPSSDMCRRVGQRVDCGERGVSPAACQKRGCCFDSSVKNAAFCFRAPLIIPPAPPVRPGATPLTPAIPPLPTVAQQGTCADIPAVRRGDCGRGVTRDECLRRRCCYDPATGLCYFNIFVRLATATQCVVAGPQRTDCGRSGISSGDCQRMGCCFDSSIKNVPHCFVPLPETTVSVITRRALTTPSTTQFVPTTRRAGGLQTPTLRTFTGPAGGVTFGPLTSPTQRPLPPAPPPFLPDPVPAVPVDLTAQCSAVEGPFREDCGHGGITRQQCRQRACCFEKNASGRPFCYFNTFIQIPPVAVCRTVLLSQRRECGEAGINRLSCVKRGCCFDNSISDVLYCFRPPVILPPVVPVPPGVSPLTTRLPIPPTVPQSGTCAEIAVDRRRDCGRGISREQCLGRRCCYDTTGRSPTCYFNLFIRIPTALECASVGVRTDCGQKGISRNDCERRGCCFDNSISNVPHCFSPPNRPPSGITPTLAGPTAPASSADSCSAIPVSERQIFDCGNGGISRQECERRGCCFDDTVKGVPFCFVKRLPTRAECADAASLASVVRQDCGSPDISPNECRRRGCCYDQTRALQGPVCFVASPLASTTSPRSTVTTRNTATTRRRVTTLTPTFSTPTRSTMPPRTIPPVTCSNIGIDQRIDCGFPGITEARCQANGCCHDRSVGDAVWCFEKLHELPDSVICPLATSQRMDCGFPGIGQEACERKGCCFDSSVGGVPWCYSKIPPSLPSAEQCDMETIRIRRSCGSPDTTSTECVVRNCCYDDAARNGVKCFFPDGPFTTTPTTRLVPSTLPQTTPTLPSGIQGNTTTSNVTSQPLATGPTLAPGQTTLSTSRNPFTTQTGPTLSTRTTPGPLGGATTNQQSVNNRFTTPSRPPRFQTQPLVFNTPAFGTPTTPILNQGSGGNTGETITRPAVTQITTTPSKAEMCARKPPRERFDCNFDDEDGCVNQGCCFDDSLNDRNDVPDCYFPDKSRPVTNGPACDFSKTSACHQSMVFDGSVCRSPITVTMSLVFLVDYDDQDREDMKLQIANALNNTLCLRLRSLRGTELKDDGGGVTWETDSRVLEPVDAVNKSLVDRIYDDGDWFAGFPVDPSTLRIVQRASNDDNCTLGSRFNGLSDRCEPCPRGSYQVPGVNRFCINCPRGKSTPEIGTIGKDKCRLVCSAGEEEEGDDCQDCPNGSYKEDEGAGLCVRCKPGQTTASPGSTSKDKCLDTCSSLPDDHCGDGQCEWDPDNKRVICQCRIGVNGAQCNGQETLVTSVTPRFGPQAGGTIITIKGVNLNSTDGPTVRIGDVTCDVLSPTDLEIKCTTRELKEDDLVGDLLEARIRWVTTDSTHPIGKYTYRPNPVITGFEPTKTILSGGINITVTGENLDSVAKPIMMITSDYDDGKEVDQYPCDPVQAGRMLCPAALIKLRRGVLQLLNDTDDKDSAVNDLQSDLSFHFGFKLDGVTMYEDEFRKGSDKIDIDVYRDPVIYDFSEALKTYRPYWPFHDSNIVVEGDQLLLGVKDSEYSIDIGEGVCTDVIVDSRMTCNPPADQPGRKPLAGDDGDGTTPVVQVKVGIFLTYNVGLLDYEMSLWEFKWARIGLICCSIVLILVIVFIILAVKCRHRAPFKKIMTWGREHRGHRGLLALPKDVDVEPEDDIWDDPHPDSLISRSSMGSHVEDYPYGTIATRMHNEPVGAAGSISGSMTASSISDRSALY